MAEAVYRMQCREILMRRNCRRLIRVVIQRPGPSCLQQMKAAVRQETLRKDLRKTVQKTVQKKKLPSHKVNKGSKMNKKRNYTVYI